ncbi:hypothetical protein [Hyphococcus luteus]|uniref:Uncharacterized protein n=1 Tax=Hyphococcus luteus TaxID=2058213 RepID=A0A2S7K7V6_9PROT|nr:hypothetical protein [Marinicaulis flavus]PQA88549.1 hypothetical protein CW354_09715 [Marinicaulis flavus]
MNTERPDKPETLALKLIKKSKAFVLRSYNKLLQRVRAKPHAQKGKADNKQYPYNIVSKIDYWDDRGISFDSSFLPSKAHSALLVQRREPLTKDEIQLQRLIQANEPRSYSLTGQHLYRIQLRDEPKPIASTKREPTRFLQRFHKESLEFLQNFKYIISINQRFPLTETLRSISAYGIVISIYTDDFSTEQITFDPSFSDIIIAPEIDIFNAGRRPIRRFVKAATPMAAYLALVDTLAEFAPKDFNILAPIHGPPLSPEEKLDPDNPENHDIALILSCDPESAPACDGAFRDYLRDISKSVSNILCTEQQIYRYSNLIQGFPNTIADFLEIALLDGARIDVRYENDNSHI